MIDSIIIISIIFGLASILAGIWVIGRCEGKLRTTAIILVTAAIVLTIKTAITGAYTLTGSAINLTILREIGYSRTVDIFLYFFITLFILIALVIMNKMISEIANQYGKK